MPPKRNTKRNNLVNTEIIPEEELNISDFNENKPKRKGFTIEERKAKSRELAQNLGNYKSKNLNALLNSRVASKEIEDYNMDILSNKALFKNNINFNPNMLNPNYAQYQAQKKGGQSYVGDYDGDGINDVIVNDKNGKIMYVNGHSIKPTNRPYIMKYYASDDFKNSTHLTKGGLFQLFNDKDFTAWAKALPSEDKKELNKKLKDAGIQTLRIKSATAGQVVKEQSKSYYSEIVDLLSEKYNINPTDLRKKLPAAVFSNILTNTMFLGYSGLINNIKSEAQLSNLIKMLKQQFNNKELKDEVEKKSKLIFEYMIENSLRVKLGEIIYNTIVLKQDNKINMYKSLIEGLGNFFKEHIDDFRDYYTIRVQE